MQIPLYQIDAFTDRLFAGNPAAICLLEDWLDDPLLQAIALENNLSETAFLVRRGDDYELRWFTPTVEVDLCGHATLASAHLVLDHLEPGRRSVSFSTRKAGVLTVERQDGWLAMDFPARPPTPSLSLDSLDRALGCRPSQVLKARDLVAVFEDAKTVQGLRPDFAAVAALECWALIVTAPGEDGIDFVSRFFAPGHGVPEDPVTGSAHCTLVPYWAKRLGKTELTARQLSARGGALRCRLENDRVIIAGQATLYLEGRVHLPTS
jgi:PhzF family phenazine biosynthesis protein